MMKMITLWLPPVLWAGVIFGLSSIPDLKSGLEFDFTLRKLAHVTEYLLLTGLLYRAFTGTFTLDRLRLIFYPAVIVFFYAITDEIHQTFVPGRSGHMMDVFVDTIGIVLFYIAESNKEKIFRIFFRKRHKSL